MAHLYLECLSGISGDMFVAAMLGLGADQEELKKVLASVPVSGFQANISKVKKAGIEAWDFNVVLDEAYENHDHDMAYLYRQTDSSGHDGVGGHAHSHEGHVHEGHIHVHRGMREVMDIIQRTQMTEGARNLAANIFTILGEAEAKAHGMPLEEVHFHEVGAIDSIVDIIAAAVCFDSLSVDSVILPVLYEGRGRIRCQHGILPIPVPAVANIARDNGLPLHITEAEGELVTPTGAAIAAAIWTQENLPAKFRIQKIGIGAGKREYQNPSLLRAMLIECVEVEKESDWIVKLESNIDDCTGENLGYVMEKLFEVGARDVHYMPIFMKKNRPAYQLNVICKEKDVKALEHILFCETTTIGIRKVAMERSILQREEKEVETTFGTVKAKVCAGDFGKRVYPEYESIATICKASGKPFYDVFRQVERELDEKCRE